MSYLQGVLWGYFFTSVFLQQKEAKKFLFFLSITMTNQSVVSTLYYLNWSNEDNVSQLIFKVVVVNIYLLQLTLVLYKGTNIHSIHVSYDGI